ncbi:MAG TPA: peptidoglycan-binding protein [Chthoniobacterales bacterium]|nr:peptidoglycan-binding protein [Chthoniobacterales bacterium]
MKNRGNRIVLSAITIVLVFAVCVRADNNVEEVQTKLRDAGFYSGEIDGVFSNDVAAALSRYQIRNGLPITGHLDVDTAKALGIKPAVATSNANVQQRTSKIWERLRKSDQQFPGKTVWHAPSPSPNETENTTAMPPRPAHAATPAESQSGESLPQESPPPGNQVPYGNANPASAPPTTAASSRAADLSQERLRDYVGAFVLAGLDPNVGSEADFFADRVTYYNQGLKDRDEIREDLKRYDSRWPGRKFWLAGDISVKPQGDQRMRVTFPLRYELRNGAKHLSGKVAKTLVIEQAGDDLQIVAVNERKAK